MIRYTHIICIIFGTKVVFSFPDLIRVTDEIDDILEQYIFGENARIVDLLPGSVSFVSGLRKTLFDATAYREADARKHNHIFVEVALRPEVVSEHKRKFDKLAEDDPAQIPDYKTTLQAAATFRDLNTKHVDLIDNLMLGKRHIDNWEYHLEQRFEDAKAPETKLTTLLNERRRNPNLKFDSYNDPKTSNQARLAKIWVNCILLIFFSSILIFLE